MNYELCSQVASMKINESRLDSLTRIIAAIFLLYLSSGGELAGGLAIIAGILGVILLLTGAVGFCPLYALLRFKKPKK
jgi:hypothetical protein